MIMKRNKPIGLTDCMEFYLDYCLSRDLSPETIYGKRFMLNRFLLWCFLNGVYEITEIDLHLVRDYGVYAKKNYRGKTGGGITTESLRNIITAIKVFVDKLYLLEVLDHNPLGRIELPRKPRRVPSHVLDEQQVSLVLQQPLLKGKAGTRDKAILEVFYATAIRPRGL